MTEKEARARIAQMYPWECWDDAMDKLLAKAQDETPGKEDEALEAFAILNCFADESEKEKARQLLAANEEKNAAALLRAARHPNADVRKAALRAMEHTKRSEKEHGK
jgi:HEAT repeat protein